MPVDCEAALQRGYEEEREGGKAVSQHDGQTDPEDPACGPILPVPNRPWGPAVVPRKGPQHAIAYMNRAGICLASITTAVKDIIKLDMHMPVKVLHSLLVLVIVLPLLCKLCVLAVQVVHNAVHCAVLHAHSTQGLPVSMAAMLILVY